MNINFVKGLQKALNEKGEGLAVDGVAGPATEAAVDKYDFTFGLTKKASAPPVISAPHGAKKNELWYPGSVKNFGGIKYQGHGPYNTKTKNPIGVVVHFNAGRGASAVTKEAEEKVVLNLISYLNSKRYGTITIGATGTVYQNCPLNVSHWHAGDSTWRGMNGMNDKFCGVDLLSWGLLHKVGEKFYAWPRDPKTNERTVEIPAERVVYGGKETGIVVPGFYEKVTDAARDSLFEFILWMEQNFDGFEIDNAAGHDEVRIPQKDKNDPGFIFQMNGNQMREKLKEMKKENELETPDFSDHQG